MSKLRRIRDNQEDPLCANIDETLPPSEFNVEGGEGFRHECPA
jgi:hypothetical protein